MRPLASVDGRAGGQGEYNLSASAVPCGLLGSMDRHFCHEVGGSGGSGRSSTRFTSASSRHLHFLLFAVTRSSRAHLLQSCMAITGSDHVRSPQRHT